MDDSHVSFVVALQAIEQGPVLLRCLHPVGKFDADVRLALGPLVHCHNSLFTSMLVAQLRILGCQVVSFDCSHHSRVPSTLFFILGSPGTLKMLIGLRGC